MFKQANALIHKSLTVISMPFFVMLRHFFY